MEVKMGNKIPDTHAMDLIMALSLEVLKGNPISNKCYPEINFDDETKEETTCH